MAASTVAAVLIAGLSFSGRAALINVRFFPDNYNRYLVELEAPAGVTIFETSETLKAMAGRILAWGPGKTTSVEGFAGLMTDEDHAQHFSHNIGYLAVDLPPLNERRFDDYPANDPMVWLDSVRSQLQPPEGWRLRVRPQQEGPSTGRDVSVRIVGADTQAVEGLAKRMETFLSKNARLKEHLVDLRDDRGYRNRVYRYRVKQNLAREHGISPVEVGRLTAGVIHGRLVGEFRNQDEQIDLRLKVAGVKEPADAGRIPLIDHPVGPLTLDELNDTLTFQEHGSLNRFNGYRAVTFGANLRAGSHLSPAAVVHHVQQYYEDIRADFPGATLDFSGEYADTRRSFTSLAYAFILALLLIYLILATQFQSYLQPMIILSSVLFSFIGIVLGIFVTRSVFTINSFIAMVGVTGIVVNDALILVTFINERYRAGLPRTEACLDACRTRLRPILLTTLTTTLAFLPMALGIPEPSLVWGAMATVFVAGLCSATFLTLFIVPLAWDLLTPDSATRAL
ncbi:MAG: efflux RND transporter permease subunit [Acidobacteriota bacterium]|nr:efflux RND transporter permease subunit [Acidobacteriota bacterium]